VASGWEILVTQAKKSTIATVARINGKWRVIDVSTAPIVPYEPRLVTGPPASDFELRSSATVVCVGELRAGDAGHGCRAQERAGASPAPDRARGDTP
jgi:hypothetical protein